MSKNQGNLLRYSLEIPMFDDIMELSRITRLSTKLIYCLSMKSERYYKRFTIPKKNGEYRVIDAPSYTMTLMQKWILINILYKVQPSVRAMAFRKGSKFGCKENASYHIDTLYGLAIDLKDFFPSITSNKVYMIFKSLGYGKLPATILTNLCTLNGQLPQGGVCSPCLSNLVCLTLDNRLIGLCEKRGVRYTRYADDMYFSCDNKDILHRIYKIIEKIIVEEGFNININKTRYQSPANKKLITGITISSIENVYTLKAKRILKKEVRAAIFRAIISGEYTCRSRVLGIVSYINYIEGEDKYIKKIKKYIASSAENIRAYKELVEKFNENKFYKDLEDIEYTKVDVYVTKCLTQGEIDELINLQYYRRKYLKRHGLQDICSYIDWPQSIIELSKDYGIIEDEKSPFS